MEKFLTKMENNVLRFAAICQNVITQLPSYARILLKESFRIMMELLVLLYVKTPKGALIPHSFAKLLTRIIFQWEMEVPA
jgi:hypothetical protein